MDIRSHQLYWLVYSLTLYAWWTIWYSSVIVLLVLCFIPDISVILLIAVALVASDWAITLIIRGGRRE